MRNIIDLDEFFDKYCAFKYRYGKLNESNSIFSDNVFNKVYNLVGQNCLVINDINFAQRLSEKSETNKILCIYTNINEEDNIKKFKKTLNCEYVYSGDIECVNKTLSDNTKERLHNIVNDYLSKQGDFIFDFIFNITLNSYGNIFDFEFLSEFNKFILFELGVFIPNQTIYYSFDDKDVSHKFDAIIYKAKNYHIKKIRVFKMDDWNSLGFKSNCDIHMNVVSVPNGDSLENLDETDNNGSESFEDNSDIIRGVIEPQIYAFRTDIIDNILPHDVTALKVGDTNRGVDVRMDEWSKDKYYPGLQHEDDWCWSAVVSGCGEGLDGKVFRDISIHKILVDKFNKENVKKEEVPEGIYYSKEFFKNCTPDDVEKSIEFLKNEIRNNKRDIISKLKDNSSSDVSKYSFPTHDESLPYEERELQTQTIENFYKRYVDGEKEMLMYAVMRFGKTYTACRCAQEFGGKFTVVVSGKADVKDEWVNQVNPYKEFDGYDMYVSKGTGSLYSMLKKNKCKTLTEYLKKFPDKHVMLFLTLQDLSRYANKTKSELKYYQCFINTFVDMLIIDEAHYGAQGKSYGKGIGETEDIVDDKEYISDSDTKRYVETLHFDDKTIKLHLSGTPYDLVARGKFNEGNMISHFGFDELIKAKHDWEKENKEKIQNHEIEESKNPYYGIPEMISFGYNFSSFSLNSVRREGEVNFVNLFKVNEETGNFVYENDVLEMFQKIDCKGEEQDHEVLDLLDLPEIKKGNMCKHIVIVLPHKNMCDTMEDFLISHSERGDFKNLDKYKIINIAGVKRGMDTSDAKRAIRDEEKFGNKTISLTVKQMLTGVSVPQWDTMFYMKDGMSAQEYDQARFRIQTPNVKKIPIFEISNDLKKIDVLLDENGEVKKQKVDMKPQTIFVDFSAERIYNMLFQKYSAELNGEDPERILGDLMPRLIKRDVDVLPIVINQMGKLTKINFENLMNLIRENFSNDVFYGKRDIFDVIDNDFDTNGIFDKDIYEKLKDIKISGGDWCGKKSKKSVKGRMTKSEDGESSSIDDRTIATPTITETFSDYCGDDPDDESTCLEPGDPGYEEEVREMEEYDRISDDVDSVDSDIDDFEDSDYDTFDIDDERDKEEFMKKWKGMLRNLFMYILCRNDNMDLPNFHRLWDTMRADYKNGGHPENWRLILKIFDDENEKTINWNNVFDEETNKVRDCYDTRFAQRCVKRVKKSLQKIMWIVKRKRPDYYMILMKAIVQTIKEFGNRDDFEQIRKQLENYGRNALGGTSEVITPQDVIKPISEKFVISNSSRILDCYGSKVGEILNYIIDNYEDVNIDNYYLICKNNLISELSKVTFKIIFKKKGKTFRSVYLRDKWLEEHILVYDYMNDDGYYELIGLENAIKEKWDWLNKKDEKTGEYMKFDIVVGNPPYLGKGTPMYMKITKTIYDSCLSDNGVMIMVNPTSLVDNKYDGNANYENLKKEYKKLKLKDFYYNESLRDMFGDAKIGNGIAIFTYSKKGEYTLFDEEIKIKRFGEDYLKDKEIIGLVKDKPMIADYEGYKKTSSTDKKQAQKVIDGCNIGDNFVVMSFNRGNTDEKTGGHKWDWTTLQSEEYLVVKTRLKNMGMNLFDFGSNRLDSVKLIKWSCTDFISYIVLYYKYLMSNPPALFDRLPQPPTYGDYSDESLCEYFGLTQEQMDYIHKKVKKFGWKVYFNCTEEELLQKIEELNSRIETEEPTLSDDPTETDFSSMTDEELIDNYHELYNEFNNDDFDGTFREYLEKNL